MAPGVVWPSNRPTQSHGGRAGVIALWLDDGVAGRLTSSGVVEVGVVAPVTD